jgi:putative RecB family exonuclease
VTLLPYRSVMALTGTLPAALSPSRLQDFQSCPRKFQHGVIDKLPQPATYATAKGNLVHEVLEHLFAEPPELRTPDAARALVPAAEESVLSPRVREEIGLTETTLGQLRRETDAIISQYFAMEDPSTVATVGVEMRLREPLDGAPVLGILDRLDEEPSGDLRIVDYKTGKLPNRDYDAQTFANTEIYAALCEAHLGRRPASIRLMYLAEGQSLDRPVTETNVAARRRSAADAWRKINEYYQSGEFPARPSRNACRFCSFREVCRANGVAVPG